MVKPILGTMNFGLQVNTQESVKMVKLYQSMGFDEFDTAYVYNDGNSEKLLGHALKLADFTYPKIATKVNPRITGKLDRHSIIDQVSKSLQRIGIKKIETLYLHFPDPSTPILETLSVCAELHEKGLLKRLGLSNYHVDDVKEIYDLCTKHGWPLPSVYQGLYNCLSRNIEDELISVLRELSISFYAYNPLAGGILSGKYSDIDNILPGRFTERPNYKNRYWKKEFFESFNIIKDASDLNNINILDVSFSWLLNHSKLDSSYGDGVIIGASNINQLKQNLDSFKTGKLNNSIIDALSDAWEISQVRSPKYFRTVDK